MSLDHIVSKKSTNLNSNQKQMDPPISSKTVSIKMVLIRLRFGLFISMVFIGMSLANAMPVFNY